MREGGSWLYMLGNSTVGNVTLHASMLFDCTEARIRTSMCRLAIPRAESFSGCLTKQ